MEFTIRADAPRIPHKKHWQVCVGSGHALLAMRTDYTRQLKFIHDTLGIERVRFHGIFNDDMRYLPNPGGKQIRVYDYVDVRFIFEDMYAKLNLFSKMK